MAISDDWNVDFVNKVISHIDGVLDFDSHLTTGDPPQAGDYIRGCDSGAIGKILGNYSSAGVFGQAIYTPDQSLGTLTLTNVSGRFQNNEKLIVLDSVRFDAVTQDGFGTGITLYASGGEASIYVDAIDYHYTEADETSNGFGTIFGRNNSTAFVLNDVLKKSSATGTGIASAAGATVSGDLWLGTLVNDASGMTPPGADKSVIINFDAGTEAIPRFAQISDCSVPTKTSIVQQVYGVTATGSLRLVDGATAWSNDDKILVRKIRYQSLVAGQKFKVGDKIVIKETTSTGSVTATGKIIVVDEGALKITLQNETGTITDNDFIMVRTTSDTKVALVDAPATDTSFYDTAAVANIPNGEIKDQLAVQDGLYAATESLNIIRDSNALYTYLQDTFDELGALDDDVPMTAQVALQQFTLINGWKIPDQSYRFLESGSIQDSALNNIWTDFQSLGSVEGIGNTVYAATTPLPQFYIEQNGSLVSTWWYYGHIDVLVKVKTNSDNTLTNTNDGALINGGTVTIFNRNFGDTYDHFETTTVAGVAPIPVATSNDADNQSGTHQIAFDGDGTQYTVGEEVTTTANKRGIITALSKSASAGTMDYVLTGSSNFDNNDQLTGATSSITASVNGAPTTVVAGYGSRIIIATVDGTIRYSSSTGSTTYYGEEITGSVSGASGILMNDDATNTIYVGNITEATAFANSDVITAATGGKTWTLGATGTLTATTVIQKDIGDGNGDLPYNAVVYLNRDGQSNGDTLARMYEWVKYNTRRLETAGEPSYQLLGGKGTESGLAGRFYITQDSTYALVKGSPIGTFAGGQFFGARGVFVENMANADIRNYQLIDANGTTRNPPSLQTLTVSGVVSGDRVAVFRTSGGLIQTSEFQVGAAGGGSNQAADSQILFQAGERSVSSLPQDVPASAAVRVLDPSDTGLYLSFNYSAVDRSNNIFTLTSGTIGDVTGSGVDLVQGDTAFVVLIQEEATATSISNNIIYVSTINLLGRVRSKGILPFEVTGTFGSSGATISAIRTLDSIVD